MLLLANRAMHSATGIAETFGEHIASRSPDEFADDNANLRLISEATWSMLALSGVAFECQAGRGR